MTISDDNTQNIIKLDIKDFNKCGNIWDMEKQSKLKEQFYNELEAGNRITFVYLDNEDYIGEVSLVFNNNDLDYTIPNKRIYLSRLIVKEGYRGKHIGETLVKYAIDYASKLGYSEISVGVDLDNYVAMKLYCKMGFDKIIFIGEDEQGKYVKLLRK